MKVLLVIPPLIEKALVNTPPLGLAYLASYLLKYNRGIEVKIIDFELEDFSEQIWKELERFNPDLVGIGLNTLHYPKAVEIANIVKTYSSTIKVVMGGPHATTRPEDCLAFCDIVVRGEGEITFNEIVQGKDLSTITGLSYKTHGKIYHNPPREPIENLDNLPFPAYHLLKMRKYSTYRRGVLIAIIGSRGCPFNCTFCFSPVMWGRRIRMRSPENIVNEIEYLVTNYKPTTIAFADDDLNIPLKRAIQISEEIVKRNLQKKICFTCQLRANRQFISEELFDKLKQANIRSVAFGIESGSVSVLKSMRKSISIREIKNAIKLSQKYGMETNGLFMIGNWNESFLDVLKTFWLIMTTKVIPTFSICTPFPGTDFYKTLKNSGLISNDLDWSKATTTFPLTKTNRMTKKQIYFLFKLLTLFFALKRRIVDKTEPFPNIANLNRFLLGLITSMYRSLKRLS